jgi:hypothetical protein
VETLGTERKGERILGGGGFGVEDGFAIVGLGEFDVEAVFVAVVLEAIDDPAAEYSFVSYQKDTGGEDTVAILDGCYFCFHF